MKKHIDLTQDPLYYTVKQTNYKKKKKRSKTLNTSVQDIDKVYEAIDFSFDLKQGPHDQYLKTFIKKQNYNIHLAKFGKQIPTETTITETKIETLPDVKQLFEGRTKQHLLIRSHQNKRRISDIVMRIENQQNILQSLHTNVSQEDLKFESFNPKVQASEIEHLFVQNLKKENLQIKPIYVCKSKNLRNSFYNGKQQSNPINLQNVKEKLIFDKLKEDTTCDLDPLRLQYCKTEAQKVYSINLSQEERQKEVQEIVQKTESSRLQSLTDKRKTNYSGLSFRRQLSIDKRNQIQIQQFGKFLQHLNSSTTSLTSECKVSLNKLSHRLQNGHLIDRQDFELNTLNKNQFFHSIQISNIFKINLFQFIQLIMSYSLPDCVCGKDLDHNCAHYLSNYMITQLGHQDLAVPEQNGPITARCEKKRPIKAIDMRNWIAQRYQKKNSFDKNGWYFFYEVNTDNGRGHVGQIKIQLVKNEEGKIKPQIVDYRIEGDFYKGKNWQIEYYFYK
ncbi:hypothetical protein pb186bvf_005848 [Paramecium bursaria]